MAAEFRVNERKLRESEREREREMNEVKEKTGLYLNDLVLHIFKFKTMLNELCSG